MDLETVLQSEVSQKEENKYWMLTHTCGTWKNGRDDLICKAEMETQIQSTNMDARWAEGGQRAELGYWD